MLDPSLDAGGKASDSSRTVGVQEGALRHDRPSPIDWKARFASFQRLGYASELVEAAIFRQGELERSLDRVRLSSPGIVPEMTASLEEQGRLCREIATLNETFERFSEFMGELRGLGFTPRVLGQSFSDALFRYLSSARTLGDFGVLKEESSLAPVHDHLCAKLFCQEIEHYIEDLKIVAADPVAVFGVGPSLEDVELFVDSILDPHVYLRSSEWCDVIQVCRRLTDGGVLGQTSFLDLATMIVERAHPTDSTVELLFDATASLRGPLPPDADEALCKLGVSLAIKRGSNALFERPFVSSHPILEFGYCSGLAYRLADFNLEDPERRRELLRQTLNHSAVAYLASHDATWYRQGISRIQAAVVRVMSNFEPEFGVEAIETCGRILWKEWDNVRTLWMGATHGVVFGTPVVQHVFLRHILQDPHGVAGLKAVLSEATSPLGATYHLVSGLREVLRERRQGIPGARHVASTIRALELLAHTGHDGVAAAPEVLRLLGISAFRFRLTGSLVSPPIPCVMDSDARIKRRARALIAQWEKRYGSLSATIRGKLDRFDRFFAR